MDLSLPIITADIPTLETSTAAPSSITPGEPVSTRDVIEMVLKDRRKLDLFLRHETGQRRVIPKLLAISVSGFVLYGVTATVMLNLLRQAGGYWLSLAPASYWTD